MTEVFSITQLPLPPYQASPMKLDSEWTMPLSFETGLNFDSFNFEAALLDAEFSLDDIIVPDVLAISEPFGNVGDLSFPYDFSDVTGCGDLWDVPHSPSNCSLESNHSSTSIAIESGGFLRKFPTGARSRRVNGASRSCSRPSRSEYSTQSAHAAPPSHLQPCRCLENTPESTPIELAVTKLCWPPLELPSMELTRQQRVQRYREKRKRRTFAKTIRYEARRAYAEVRPRIKGRFATKEEAAAIRATRIPDGIQAPFMKTEG